MRVSIITPVFNGEKFLRETIESVLAESYSDWEYIIVDDGSSDSSVAIAQEYTQRDERIRLVAQPNGGVASARNLGIAHSTPGSEFLIFLDQDDVWRPSLLEQLVRTSDANPWSVSVHCLCTTIDGEGNVVGPERGTVWCRHRRKIVDRKIVESDDQEPTTFATMVCECTFPTPGAILIRRLALDRVKIDDLYFDPAAISSNDWDLYLRLCVIGDIAFLPKPLVKYRRHEGNVSGHEAHMMESSFTVRTRINANPQLTALQREMAVWRYSRLYATIERHNSNAIAKWIFESYLQGRIGDALRLTNTWWRTQWRYGRLRAGDLESVKSRPIPRKLLSSKDIHVSLCETKSLS